MRSRPHRWTAVATIATAALPFAAAGAADAAVAPGLDLFTTGPNTLTLPYIRPVAPGVDIESLLTVDDAGSAFNGYEMVGVPDGLGATKSGNKVVVYENQELGLTAGIPRAHGQAGAFVSRFVLSPKSGAVLRGSDLIQPGVKYWDYLTSRYSDTPNAAGSQPDGDAFPAYSPAFNRFCSASLTAPGQLYDAETGVGYDGQIYFANEESGDEGRSFAVLANGRTAQLPRLGLLSWENTVAAYNTTDTTLVMGDEDSSAGQLRVYVGQKTSVGTPVRRAGLANGANFVLHLKDESITTDAGFRTSFGKGHPQPFDLNEVDWDQSGAAQNAEATLDGFTLNRIEDGTFDPSHPNDYYFTTTEGAPVEGRDGGGVWRVRWTDIEQPELGGTLELVLDGSEAPYLNKPDNVTIDNHGNLLIQEDPGTADFLSRITAYRISDGATGVLAQFDAAQFTPGQPDYITNNEESSGIIDTEATFGLGTFLFDAQVHVPPLNNAQEYVERGQLLTMHVADWTAVYGS